MKKVFDKQKPKDIFDKQKPMKKIILTMIVGLFLLTLASAGSSLGEVKQFDCIDLYQTCPSCSYVNLTAVKYPNTTVWVTDLEMTKTGTEYNYTFCGTDTTGEYFYTVKGDKSGTETSETISFNVTPLGKLGVTIFLVVLAFGFIGLGMGLKIPPLGFIGSILLILAGMYVMIYGLSDVTNLYTKGAAIALLGLGFILMIAASYEWLSFGDMDD